MNFHILDNITDKLKVLNHCKKVYHSKNDDCLYLAKRDDSCVYLDESDKKELISFYNQMYYQKHYNACAECKEQRINEININFNIFLNKIKNKY